MRVLFLLSLFGILCEADVRSRKFEDTKLYKLYNSADSKDAAKSDDAGTLGVVSVYHSRDIGYLAKIFVNGKPHSVQLDLGSSLTWLSSIDCMSKCEDFCQIAALCSMACYGKCCTPENANPNFACAGKSLFAPEPPFQPTRSGTTWTITKGSQNTVTGDYGKVDFQFGLNPTTAANAEFGLAKTLSLSFTLWYADGVLGLAKKAETDDDVKPIVSTLATPLVQFALTQCSRNEPDCGKVAFGNESLLGYCKSDDAVTFKTITNDWQFVVTSFELTGITPQQGTWQVAMDINDPLITLNADLFKQLTDFLGAKYDDDVGLYNVDCSKKIELKISSNGRHYLMLDQNVLITRPDINKKCYLQVQAKLQFDSSPVDIVFGTPAMSHYCLTFKPLDETVTFYESA